MRSVGTGSAKSLRWVAIFIMIFVAAFTWYFVREARLVLAQPVSNWTEDVTADCAVVVTGGPNRIREGFDLLARKSVQKLIISGVNPRAELREIFPLWPFYGDLREHDVLLERRSRSTYGNAQQSLPIVEALRCRDIILVTSRAHMYRALRTFRAEFPSGYPISTRAVIATTYEPTWSEVISEVLKSFFYSLWAY